MDIFDLEILRFWEALNKNEVLYLMVGGIATNLHGYQRTTEDIDIWKEDTLENRKKIRKAFDDRDMGDFEPLGKNAVYTWLDLFSSQQWNKDRFNG